MTIGASNVPRVHGLDDFLLYMREESNKLGSGDSLADYIQNWLWSGRGVNTCFGDFEIFLKVIPLIVDEWHRDPTILYFSGDPDRNIPPIEYAAASTFGSNGRLHAIFDRDNFTAAVFNWKYLDPNALCRE